MNNKIRKPDLPKERAKFVEEEKGGKVPDSLATLIAGILVVMAFFAGFFTLAGSGFAGILRAAFALASLCFAARDLQTLTSSRIIAVASAILFVLGVIEFVSFAMAVAP